jgi:hypothetical protein
MFFMYRRPKFLEVLLEIRQEMAREADYDVDLFAEMVRAGKFSRDKKGYDLTARDTEKQVSKQDSDKRPLPKRQS